MRIYKILAPTAILGYGFPESSFHAGLAAKPDLIAVDGGSSDPGPYYLGSGKAFTDYYAVKRDLQYLLTAALEQKIPLIVGTAGGSGAAPHLEWCKKIVAEIASEQKLRFKMALIYADLSFEQLRNAWHEGRIQPLSYAPELTEEILQQTSHPVAQMGVEPLMAALKQGAQVILAGRTYDPACFAALPILEGYDPALALHMGKILECAAIASSPGSGSDCVLGLLSDDHFLLQTLSTERRFTAESTAAHSLYEKSDPMHLVGPGGLLDLEDCKFIEEKETVRVSGSRFVPATTYKVKLEGARAVGYRSICLAGTRDPLLIAQIETVISEVSKKVAALLGTRSQKSQLHVHLYGKNAVMGRLEPEKKSSHELAILLDVVADTQKEADSVCSLTRSTLLHYGYAGRISTAGNLAFPFSPSDIAVGQIYEFSLYHLLDLGTQHLAEQQNQQLFPVEIVEFS